MDFFMQIFGKIVSFLPNSFLLTALVTYDEELEPFYDLLSYVNWFIPFDILVAIFSGWAAAMLSGVIGFHFFRKL